jgi:hypothetical protein
MSTPFTFGVVGAGWRAEFFKAPGLTPRSVFEQLSAMQMLDVHFPTTDGPPAAKSNLCRHSLRSEDLLSPISC